jgi:hypothetical protein
MSGRRTALAGLSWSVAVLGWLCGCAPAGPQGAAGQGAQRAAQPADATPGACPARVEAPAQLPGTRPEQATLEYWLARHDAAELDRPLMDRIAIERYDREIGRRPGHELFSQRDLREPPDARLIADDVSGRLGFLRRQLDAAAYLDARGAALPAQARDAFDAKLPEALRQELRVVLEATPLRCGPYPGPLYAGAADPSYDRNACSTLRAQEPLQVLADWPGGMRLVRTRYALGWLAPDAQLSPALPPELVERFVSGTKLRAAQDVELRTRSGQALRVPKHTLLARDEAGQIWLAGAAGFEPAPAVAGLIDTRRELTRRALLTTAFDFMGTPYGLGDSGGGRDCSRILLDLFESFDLALPRHSGWQAQAGSYRVELAGLGDAEKLRLIDAAARGGAVLLHLPGHVMLYLGRSAEGTPMVFHALGEYAAPCAAGGESVVALRRTVVSDLELGRGSKRHALIERLTRLTVLGGPPGDELGERALRPLAPPALPADEAQCTDSLRARIFISPRTPQQGSVLRAIAVTEDDPGAATLWLYDPDGKLVPGDVHSLGGPPYTRWLAQPAPSPGRWTALLGNADGTLACKRIRVTAPLRREAAPSTVAWDSRWSWELDTENLWSAFVEQLFDYPLDDERTWTNLHDLLRDPTRNLLYGHLGLEEDNALELIPDCADLPYALRAYFAWKLALPFGFRRCSRGAPGRPPQCGEPLTNHELRVGSDALSAFDHYVNRQVRPGVHSASGRTTPADDATDLYPVALSRRSLAPGTVYADPYGHVMIVVRWYAQGRDDPQSYGVLLAAEAQPDSTLGRRRFWEGSFLFDPDTSDVGAGFKHFRPLARDPASRELVAPNNAALAKNDHFAPFSLEQYQGDKASFYDRMDALINPQPLQASDRLASLLDALDEAVRRRVLAIDTGETFMRERGFQPIEMPVGHEVFETSGAWEDYSTPSRDMRLLIALDTVTGFVARVRRAPERYGLQAGSTLEPALVELQRYLERNLATRHIEYTRSDGTKQVLSLTEVAARAERLEAAYNPNDCVELRWGAAEGSPELASCARRAPEAQRKLMSRYRTWFASRSRPARGAKAP